MSGPAKTITQNELGAIFDQVNNWGRWGPDDEKGALNLISPDKSLQASALVKEGLTISCSLPLATQPGPDNPNPVAHHMVKTGDVSGDSCSDYFAIAPHGLANTHLDALCHYFYKGQMYNGFPASSVNSEGATANAIDVAQNGLVTRGVLLDIPRLRGVDWLEPGEAIYIDELEAAESSAKIRVEEGDILLVRTGRFARQRSLGESSSGTGLSGLHGTCIPWVHQRGISVLGADGVNDVIPSGVEGSGISFHLIAIPSIGLHLIDNCDLEMLAATCVSKDRWEFMFVLAPLKLLGGTASPVNPIAVF
ncbi:cyclase family protein [Dehalococcoidia bacterium]|nr:cyclase family protein [Dehalococcoidia bacterium]